MSFQDLQVAIEDGIKGKNEGIPTGFPRLNKYVGIRKRIFTLLVGASGSGKSSYLHTSYILNPFDAWVKMREKNNIKFKVILFSMERSKIYTLAKWVSRKIFINEAVLIPIPKLLGWWDTKLSKDEHDLFLSYKDYINELLEVVDIVEGTHNPTGIYKYIRNYAENNGKFEKSDEYHTVYIPNHSNEIVIPCIDHMGLTKLEKGLNSKKEAIDKLTEYCQITRDQMGYSPVFVSQLNRGLSNPIYQKIDSFEPTIDDVKESGTPAEASDSVISIFDPIRFRTTDSSYDVNKFIDKKTGDNYFRSIKVLKNTYGADSVKIGMAFQGATGNFVELPKPKDMENFDYENSLFNGTYFL